MQSKTRALGAWAFAIWRGGTRVQWLVWLGSPVVVLAAACWWQNRISVFAEQQHSGGAARQRLDFLLRQAVAPASQPTADFVMGLPQTLPSLPLLSLVRRSAEAHGVTLNALSASEQAATATALGRLNIEASLRGGYAPIKQMLADVVAHEQGRVLVQSLSINRSVNGAELEAQFVLIWPTRPTEVLAISGAAGVLR